MYSGKTSTAEGYNRFADVAQEMKNDPSLRVIDQTEAAIFLESEEFKAAVAKYYDISVDELEDRNNVNGGGARDWLFNGPDSPWAIASKNFVMNTSGDVRLMVGLETRHGGILYDTELAALVEKLNAPSGGITSVDGVSRESLLLFENSDDLREGIF